MALDLEAFYRHRRSACVRHQTERFERSSMTTAMFPHSDILNAGEETHRFSTVKAIRQAMIGKVDGIEAETTQEYERRTGRSLGPNVFVLPFDMKVSPTRAINLDRRALDTSSGAGAIGQKAEVPFAVALRNRLLLRFLGARFVTGVKGTYFVPRFAPGGSVEWVPEGGTPAESATAMDQIAFSPKRVRGFVDVSRSYLRQTNPDGGQNLIADMSDAIACGIDAAALTGDGSDEPLGLLNDGDVPTVSLGTNGGTPTNAVLTQAVREIAEANGERGRMAWVTSPVGRETLQNTPKVANTPVMLWDDLTNTVAGFPAYATSAVPKDLTKGTGTNLTAAILGSWDDLQIVTWGPGLEVLVDPFSFDTAGIVRISVHMFADIKPRNPSAMWRKIVDIAVS